MKIYRTIHGIVIENENVFYKVHKSNWDAFINQPNLRQRIIATIDSSNQCTINEEDILPPIVNQELWACGVTYLRSKEGREEESKTTGASDFYSRVYEAERPEVFFKATPHRVRGHKQLLRIRNDSEWNVPEPELTLVVNSNSKIVGYTIGNDMSSRSIEGENPLYLPQAKTYDGCASLGPCILIQDDFPSVDDLIIMNIKRGGNIVFDGSVRIRQMKRSFDELVSYVFRECSFPHGCLIMTGTGIVPPNDFTLHHGDEVNIEIAGIGRLTNKIE